MTREEARKAAEVMLAYADGKEVEFKVRGDDFWRKSIDDIPLFNWERNDYRIKPEPTYRPFKNKEECWAEMQKHQPYGWVKEINDGSYRLFGYIPDEISYDDDFANRTFADGTPFGIKEE